MKAVSTSEASVNFYETAWHYIPEDSHRILDVQGSNLGP